MTSQLRGLIVNITIIIFLSLVLFAIGIWLGHSYGMTLKN